MIKTFFLPLFFATSLYGMESHNKLLISSEFPHRINEINSDVEIAQCALKATLFLSHKEREKLTYFLQEKVRILKNLLRSNSSIHYSQLFFFHAATLSDDQHWSIDTLNKVLQKGLQKIQLHEQDIELGYNHLQDLIVRVSGKSKNDSIICNLKLLNKYTQIISNSSIPNYDTTYTQKYAAKNDVMREPVAENKKFF